MYMVDANIRCFSVKYLAKIVIPFQMTKFFPEKLPFILLVKLLEVEMVNKKQ